MAATSDNLELLEPASPEGLLPDSGMWWWWVAAAVTAVLVLGVMIWLRRRKPVVDGMAAIRKVAFAEAGAALAAIAAADVRDAVVLASLILRKYLAAAAGDPALYETHEEFVARHDALAVLTPEVRAAAEAGFSRMAALKYAPAIPAVTAAEVIADARALLETLHQGFAP